ncbi:MAG TPA: superoxide dismutase family protein [Burkholderiales bacterium]|nr:superoxide dismutase family protein [Burkholderiales bacterium]
MRILIAALSCSLMVAGCAWMPGWLSGKTATANLQPTKGNKVGGTVTFTQKGDKVLVVAKVNGLKPGMHGFHVHEKGDCSAADGMSAGGHFNPQGKQHGGPDSADHHAGDLGNLNADSSGNAAYSYEAPGITLDKSAANSIVGRSVIVHANRDDYTPPAGNSGGRIACGVIVLNEAPRSGY